MRSLELSDDVRARSLMASMKNDAETEEVRRTVGEAIDDWYSNAWHWGVRLTGDQRQALADHIARRWGPEWRP